MMPIFVFVANSDKVFLVYKICTSQMCLTWQRQTKLKTVLQEPVKSASVSLPCSCDATSFSSCNPALSKPLPKVVAESIPRRIL